MTGKRNTATSTFTKFLAALFCFQPPPDSLPLSLTPPHPKPPSLFTVEFHCGPENRPGGYCCCREGRGVFPPASPSPPAESKHLCVAAGDVMAQKQLKAASLGNPISGSPDIFSPLLDCYSRTAWMRLRGFFWLSSHTPLVLTASVNSLNSNKRSSAVMDFVIVLFWTERDLFVFAHKACSKRQWRNSCRKVIKWNILPVKFLKEKCNNAVLFWYEGIRKTFSVFVKLLDLYCVHKKIYLAAFALCFCRNLLGSKNKQWLVFSSIGVRSH